MSKKKFEKAEIEVLYGLNDVITTSGDFEVDIPSDWEDFDYGEYEEYEEYEE